MMKKAMLLGASLLFLITGVRAQSIDDARKALDQEQYALAKGILENLVAKQPKKGINYFYLGEVHIKNEYLDSAKMVFEAGLAADPKTNLNRVGLGTIELFNGNVEAAENIYSNVVKNLKKKDYLELYHMGRAYLDAPTKDYGKAMQYLNQALTRSGRKVDPLIHLAMGDAYFGAKEASHAYRSYSDALALNPDLTRAEIQLAVIIRGARAWQEAIDALNKIAESKPNYAPVYRELAVTYNGWSLWETDSLRYRELNKIAVQNFKKFMDLTDYSIESRVRYADFLVFAGEYEELEEQAMVLSQVENVNPKVHRHLGYALYNKSDFKGASAALNKLMETMPDEYLIPRDFLFTGLAKIRLAAEEVPTDMPQFDEGVALLRQAVDRDSSIANDLNVTGRLLFSARKFLEASKVFDISAHTEGSRNQVSDSYYFALTSLYANSGLPQGAPKDEEMIRKADKAFEYVISKAPELIEVYLRRAQNLDMLDDRTNPTGLAKPYYETFIQKAKEQGGEELNKYRREIVGILNTWAYQAVQKEDYATAKKYNDQSLELNPEDEYAKQIAEFLKQVEASAASSR